MYPEAEISNGAIRAKLYLPDPEQGYYRGTRFDWSGIVASVEFQGHQYFGPWFEHHDPKKHDGIVGPVEEFCPADGGLGYAEAPCGDTFIRIGVGVLRKPDEPAYRRYGTYDIVDAGKWKVSDRPNSIEFEHEILNKSGYAYRYRKMVRLAEGKPELWLDHTLINAGQRPIEVSQYNHNFFVIDGQPAGPDFLIGFPFKVRAAADLKGLVEASGEQIVYLQELQKGQSVLTPLEGFGESAQDHRITVENRKTGAGVRIRGDRPLSNLVFWSIRKTVCPEPYVTISVQPGGAVNWSTRYEFYTLPIAKG